MKTSILAPSFRERHRAPETSDGGDLVKLYAIDSHGAETLVDANVTDLCLVLFGTTGFEPSAHERDVIDAVRNDLEYAGRSWIGGGASPLFLLTRGDTR
jgi:hypothetical protein